MNLINLLLPLVLTNNLVMSVVKMLSPNESTVWLRITLLVLSILGIISTSALSGDPVNFDSLTGLAVLLAQAVGVALSSHFTYKVIKEAGETDGDQVG